MSRIKDIALASSGEMKIKWVERNMPVLRGIGEDFRRTKPFAGLRVALSVHLEAKTAYLCRVMEMGGAEMYVTGSNPLSTQDDVAAALAAGGMQVFARYGCNMEEYESCLCSVLEAAPNIIIDDGGDLVHLMHTKYTNLIPEVIGGCEETTTGIHRLKAMDRAGELRFPMVMVNEADCKHMFDNRYGTGQSVWDGIMRTTNLIVAGKEVVVCGYGDVGKGCAQSMRGFGARVLVTEIDPICALQAAMEGYEVTTVEDALPLGDIYVTCTGNYHVITGAHMEGMKDEAIVCNIGHFDNEIDMNYLENTPGVSKLNIKPQVDKWTLKSGRSILILAEGRLVNLGCATGHASFVMSNSFTNQTLAQIKLAAEKLENRVYTLPKELDEEVARLHLGRLGAKLTKLTPEQADYIGVKVEGPYKGEMYRY